MKKEFQIKEKNFYKAGVIMGVITMRCYDMGYIGKKETIILILNATRLVLENVACDKDKKRNIAEELWKDMAKNTNTSIWTAMNISVHGSSFKNSENGIGDPKTIKNCKDVAVFLSFFEAVIEMFYKNRPKYIEFYEDISRALSEEWDILGIEL